MQNLETIKAYSKAVWQDKRAAAVGDYFSQDAVCHSAINVSSRANDMQATVEQWHLGFPDLRVVFEDYICDGDKIVSRWRASGTHLGEFAGHRATGKSIEYSGVTIYMLQDNRIIEYWAFVDMHGIYRQLGVL